MYTISETKSKLIDPKRRANLDVKYAIHKVGHKRWDIISKNIGSELDLWRNLYDAGKNNVIPQPQQNHVYCGEEIYLGIRPDLVAKGIILNETNDKSKPVETEKSKPAKNKKKITVNKAEKIKLDNLLKKIRSECDSLLVSISAEPVTNSKSIIFRAKFEELMVVKLMVQCRNLVVRFDVIRKHIETKKLSKYTPKDEIIDFQNKLDECHEQIIELIVGYNKIINEKKGNKLISQTCIMDLINWVAYAKKVTDFNASQVIISKPELIFNTVYDKMLEHKLHGLYQSQKDIFKFVTTTDKYLALVHTMLGSGKTSMILPLCGWLTSNRKTSKTKLIFCCPNEVVLLEVAHMVYGMGVSFAIVIHDQNENKLEYKWSSFADKTNPKDSAILYLCDIYVARKLLEERMQCLEEKKAYFAANKRDPINNPLTESRIPVVPDYILIGDELSKDADSQNGFVVDSGFSVTTEVFVDLTKIAPPKIILMSATLPTAEQLPDFYNAIANNYPGMVVKSFASSEAKIGCALVSHSGELYAPHIGCETVAEIKHILSVIRTNPFVGRFYTFEVLLEMVDEFNKLSLPVPNLSLLFDDPSKANQTNIQQIAYQMLEDLIATGDDETVKKVCIMKKIIGKGVNLNTILTTDIERFHKGCLVFSSDPVETAFAVYHANFDKFLDPISERTIFQQVRLDNILMKYQREMEIFEKALKRIENKLDDGIIKKNKENDTKERVKEESWKKSAKMADNKPVWDFPKELQLCSIEHLKRVESDTSIGFGGSVCPEDLPNNSAVSVDIQTMLASGIGIYSTNSPLLDDDYLKTVLILAKKGIVKIIFTDSSIAYGTNLAVSDIIIIDEPIMSNGTMVDSIVDQHSMKTIFQMLGRAGRGGNLSYEARIYTTSLDNKLINNIRSYAKGTLDEGCKDEIYNIRKAFEVLW